MHSRAFARQSNPAGGRSFPPGPADCGQAADNDGMNAPTPTHRPALSMLDLVAVREGGTVAQALQIALRTAPLAVELGFARYWLA